MGSLSIRGVDENLSKLLKKRAEQAQTSVNQVVLEAIKRHLEIAKEKQFTREWHDLDQLFGKWSKVEYSRIQGKIDAERQIDSELWNE